MCPMMVSLLKLQESPYYLYYNIMSADWFRLYGGEIDIARKYLSSQLLDIWDNGVDIEVMPWSNMGRALNLRKK